MKTRSSIEMIKFDKYKEIKLCFYQYLIGKLIYFAYDIRSDIAFIVKQLNKHNSNPKKNYL